MNHIPCKKCLFSEIDPEGLYLSIKERIELLPADVRCDEGEYLRRLEICRSCESLKKGVCLKCGCFAELRAAKKDMHCPHELHFWQ